jgi:hypothetical protein
VFDSRQFDEVPLRYALEERTTFASGGGHKGRHAKVSANRSAARPSTHSVCAERDEYPAAGPSFAVKIRNKMCNFACLIPPVEMEATDIRVIVEPH